MGHSAQVRHAVTDDRHEDERATTEKQAHCGQKNNAKGWMKAEMMAEMMRTELVNRPDGWDNGMEQRGDYSRQRLNFSRQIQAKTHQRRGRQLHKRKKNPRLKLTHHHKLVVK